MQFIPYFEMCALVFLLITLIYYRATLYLRDFRNRAFSALLVVVAMSILTNIVSVYTIYYASQIPISVNYAVNIAYISLQPASAFFFFVFVIAISGISIKRRKIILRVMSIPFIACVLITLSAPLNNLVFYFDANMHYTHGVLFNYLYISAVLYLTLGLVCIIVRRANVTKAQFCIIVTCVFCAALATAVQHFFPRYLITGAVMVLAVFTMTLTFQDARYCVDKLTGVMDRSGFEMYLKHSFETTAKDYHLIFVILTELSLTRGLVGARNADVLVSDIATFLNHLEKGKKLFRFRDNAFALIVPSERSKSVAAQIVCRFFDPWKFCDISLSINANLCRLALSDTNSIDDALYVTNSIVGMAEKSPRLSYLDVSASMLGAIARQRKIESSLFNLENLSVCFQPIYNMKTHRFDSAEALLRMSDTVLGNIPTSEIISLAEELGLIDKIGQFVLNETYRFARSTHIWEHGITSINVNLSVLECLKSNAVDRIRKVRKDYPDVKCEICFEITESVAITMAENLGSVISELSADGIKFILDDYGSGYSNVASLFRLPFSVVKLDRELLHLCDSATKSRSVFINYINLLRDLNMDIVVEGVETENDFKFLQKLDIDKLQGYYFSGALPRESFLEFIKKNS